MINDLYIISIYLFAVNEIDAIFHLEKLASNMNLTSNNLNNVKVSDESFAIIVTKMIHIGLIIERY